MQSDDTVRIPLHARDGSVRAYALINAADADLICRYTWSMDSKGYANRGAWTGSRVVSVKMHRVILELQAGDGMHTDHINRDRLDNRRANLRVVTRAENAQNRASYRGSSSVYRGVSWIADTRKWKATVRINGKDTHLGFFTDEAEAGRVAAEARKQRMPFSVI